MEPVNGEPAERTSEATTAPRREALKKAAGAAAVAATVWAAPRVEGFSLVPAYASAGSAGARGFGGEYSQVQIGAQWYGLHTFASNDGFVRTDPTLTSVEVIVVGGGGGGGFGGGGGGQVVRNTSVLVSDPNLNRSYPAVVGVGGTGRLGATVASGAGSNPADPNVDFEWNTQPGGNGTSSSFAGSAATILAAGGGGGGALLFYTTPGLGTTHPLTLGRGANGASGGGGGGINASTTTNRTGGTGSNGVGSSPFNAGATSLAASAGTTTMATGQLLNPSAGFAGGPGGGWVGRGSAGGVTGTVGAGIIITPTQLDGQRRMFAQGGGGGAALGISPTGNSRDYLVDSGYETGFPEDPVWSGNPFTGNYVGQPLAGGTNSGGAGGFVGTALDPQAYGNGEAGSDGRGGGGGGGGFNWSNTSLSTIVATNSGRGGNGIVVIRYPIAAPTPP